ncbi:hypothetical protein [Pelosinus sp. IPA-1]|uniref:hypothetical protein n=1 Tax=Pelosinus sp. IPA-1 TaxID=3029569 RepID=UPI00243627EA|nr:hypothetical protein [Pelosinus sp. IPA-1]GMA99596.1 hypothetical protein PIPA1_23960 [Pelosinus sp. IPA-1]
MGNINTNLSAKISSSTPLKEDSDCSATIQGYPNTDNINVSSKSCEHARTESFATPDYGDTSKI